MPRISYRFSLSFYSSLFRVAGIAAGVGKMLPMVPYFLASIAFQQDLMFEK